MPAARRVTSADVARDVGLSRTTVGYVLNDVPHQKIPEHTRLRVMEAATRLGYSPSVAARSLRTGRSDLVLCLLSDIPGGGHTLTLLLEAISAELEKAGLTLVLHPRALSQRPVSDVWKAITPAAVIALGDLSPDDESAIRAAGIRVTTVIWGGDGDDSQALTISDQRSGRVQAQHLASAGHRHLGYALPDDDRLSGFFTARLEGVRMSCADLGLDEPVVETVSLDATSAAEAITRWRDREHPVTGVCAYNDEIAIAIIEGARRHGLRVPEDIAVVGADNIPLGATTSPRLTTVAYGVELAEVIAENIVAQLEDRTPVRRANSLVVDLVRRESA